MMTDTNRADLSTFSLILTAGERILFTSQERGVAPLLLCLEAFSGYPDRCTLCDRVTGLAAARLIVHSGFIAEVVTRVISLPAQDFLRRHDIRLLADKTVPGILNRTQTAPCPAEAIALETSDIGEMIDKLKKLGLPLKQLQ